MYRDMGSRVNCSVRSSGVGDCSGSDDKDCNQLIDWSGRLWAKIELNDFMWTSTTNGTMVGGRTRRMTKVLRCFKKVCIGIET